MADKTEEATSSASSTIEEISKWQPYWDENYNRYYWSDGNESVIILFHNFFHFIFLLGLGNTKRLY
jgi:hypothetical protein